MRHSLSLGSPSILAVHSHLFESPIIRELLSAPPPGTRPVLIVRDQISIVTYSSSRLTFRRDAVEKVPLEGVLLIRVVPKSAAAFDVALTRAHFESACGNIIRSQSWRRRGIYDYRHPPPHMRSFIRLRDQYSSNDEPQSVEKSGEMPRNALRGDRGWQAPR